MELVLQCYLETLSLQVQRRREERELEQAARGEELDRVRLEKEGEMFKEWQDQEGLVSWFF